MRVIYGRKARSRKAVIGESPKLRKGRRSSPDQTWQAETKEKEMKAFDIIIAAVALLALGAMEAVLAIMACLLFNTGTPLAAAVGGVLIAMGALIAWAFAHEVRK